MNTSPKNNRNIARLEDQLARVEYANNQGAQLAERVGLLVQLLLGDQKKAMDQFVELVPAKKLDDALRLQLNALKQAFARQAQITEVISIFKKSLVACEQEKSARHGSVTTSDSDSEERSARSTSSPSPSYGEDWDEDLWP